MEALNGRTDYVGLPEVAERLGVHRATVNDMVRDERLPAIRVGARWLVRRTDLDEFAEGYVRPSNAPDRRAKTYPESTPAIVALLSEFDTASASELAPLMDLHEGNVRKHLRLLEIRDIVVRQRDGQWRLTDRGTDMAEHVHSTMSVA